MKNDTHALRIVREFNAPRELVWRAWTDPAQVKEWLGVENEVAVESVTMDLREGGRFRIQMRMEDGEYYTAAGVYLEVKTPERLVYTWDWEKDGAGTEFGELEGRETRVSVEFRAQGDRTEMVFLHELFDSAERRDRHEGGWGMWLDRMAQFVESK